MGKVITCPFCEDGTTIKLDNPIYEHLVVVEDTRKHVHVHGPISDTDQIKRYIRFIAKEAGIDLEDSRQTSKDVSPR